MNENWPQKIKDKLKNMEIKKDDMGRSSAGVYQCVSDTKTYFLKIDSKGSELKNEYQNICWLNGKAPVPKIIEWDSDGYNDYLLVSKIDGLMLCDDYYMNNPKMAIPVLAKGIKLFQSIDISDCKIKNNCKIINNLENKLKLAKNNIQNNKVDVDDWNEETHKQFNSPSQLLEYLYDNKPEHEELVFTHGDYCLPNIFGHEDKVTGFIDLGRAGIADKWQDIALCTRSFWHNFNTKEYDDFLLEELGIEKDEKKLNYYILLDEFF
ncbi:MAG: aminoglycoside 3'-phosphotransferase [Treponema sp.]|jgi:kanamycin kinase/aminoglycoside 3'-phosphotransferase-3|nr:aminoglycoside 3'-phosphotransferase [Treponema sp.]